MANKKMIKTYRSLYSILRQCPKKKAEKKTTTKNKKTTLQQITFSALDGEKASDEKKIDIILSFKAYIRPLIIF